MPNLRKAFLFLFAFLLLVFAVGFLFHPRLTPVPTSSAPPTSTTRRAVPVSTKPSGYGSEYFMKFKNRGDCRELKGKVQLNFYLVSDGSCLWTPEAEKKLRQDVADEIHLMNLDADRFQISLEFSCNFIPVTMTEQMLREESDSYVPRIVQSLGFENEDEMIPTLSAQSGADSTAILFCFNRDERSFAMHTTSENGFEYCVLYSGARAFRHELYHVYGAQDLYTPEHINTISQRFFPDSIMRKSGSLVIDPLTAFTLGWCEHLDDRVREFLETVDR